MIRFLKGKYDFLDNSYPMDIPYDGLYYPSVTHAFMASRTKNFKLRASISLTVKHTDLPSLAGEFEQLSTSWNPPDVMRALLETKFGYNATGVPGLNMTIMKKLVETGSSKIEYGNSNHSTYWGICHCPEHDNPLLTENKNVLGGLLMGVRERWIKHTIKLNKSKSVCRCGQYNPAFFLYTHDWYPLLMPFCSNCQAHAMREAVDLSSDAVVVVFPKDWPDLHTPTTISGVKIRTKEPQLETVRDIQERLRLQEEVDDWDEMRRNHQSASTIHANIMVSGWHGGGHYKKEAEEPRQWKYKVIKC